MNIQSSKIKILGVLAATTLVAVFGYYISYKGVKAETDPEARIYNQSNSESRTFSVGEEGYVELRAYSDEIQGYKEKLDITIALDVSGSMFDFIEGTTQKKIARAKVFLGNFIDEIDYDDEVQLSLVSFGNEAIPQSPLRLIDDVEDKDFFKNIINSFNTAQGHTETASAVHIANDYLIAGRSNAAKYVLLVTDGGENPEDSGIYLNSPNHDEGKFDESWISNMNAEVVQGSILDRSMDNNIKYITVYANPNSDTSDYSAPAGDESKRYNWGNGGLMRFISAKTNGVIMPPSISRWDVEFPTVSVLDRKYNYLFYEENIDDIYTFIEGQRGIYLTYNIEFPPQVSYQGIVQNLDKGGRTRDVDVTPISDSSYRFTTKNLLPLEYQCSNEGEVDCIANARRDSDGTYWIENNYLNLKLKVKFEKLGTFDLLSNYTNCETGPLQKVAEKSGVEYIDPSSDVKYQTLYFGALCIKVIETSPSIVKVSYESDPGDDLGNPQAERKASFEAGDDVWIVLEISNNNSAILSDWKISDQVPDSVSGSLGYWYYQGGSKNKEGEVSPSDRKVIFKSADSGEAGVYIGQLPSGKSYIKYRYKI